MDDPLITDKTMREALATADALEEAFKSTAGSLVKLIQWKQRMFRVALACGIAVIICLGLLGWSAWDNHRANQRLHTDQLTACQGIGNDLRAREDGVWHRFVQIATAGQPQTPAQQKIIRALFAYVDKTFVPVDCVKLYDG